MGASSKPHPLVLVNAKSNCFRSTLEGHRESASSMSWGRLDGLLRGLKAPSSCACQSKNKLPQEYTGRALRICQQHELACGRLNGCPKRPPKRPLERAVFCSLRIHVFACILQVRTGSTPDMPPDESKRDLFTVCTKVGKIK